MTSRREREAALVDMILTTDSAFVYTSDEWEAVEQALTFGAPPWLRGELEDSATSYLTYQAVKMPDPETGKGASSEYVRRLRAAAAFAQKAAADLLTMIGLDDLASELNARAAVLGRQGAWMARQGSRSPARARLIEWTAIAWHCAAGKRIPQQQLASDDDSGALLDFLWSVTRPVLIGVDRFSDDFAGRDSLRKEVAKIRKDGFRWWRWDLDEDHKLSL